MEEEEINRSVFEAILGLGLEIGSPYINMFYVTNRYKRPPMYRFRLKGKDKSDPIYNTLRNEIRAFKGNLDWDLLTTDRISNFFLMPVFFTSYIFGDQYYEKEQYMNELGEVTYVNLVDEAINDIPHLAQHIRLIKLDNT